MLFFITQGFYINIHAEIKYCQIFVLRAKYYLMSELICRILAILTFEKYVCWFINLKQYMNALGWSFVKDILQCLRVSLDIGSSHWFDAIATQICHTTHVKANITHNIKR